MSIFYHISVGFIFLIQVIPA